eukprot:g2015.t1
MPVMIATRPMEFTRGVAGVRGKRAVNVPTDSDTDSDRDDDKLRRVGNEILADEVDERAKAESKRIAGDDDEIEDRHDDRRGADDRVGDDQDAFDPHRNFRSIGKVKMQKRYSDHSAYGSDSSDEAFVCRPASKMSSRPKSRKPSNVSVSSDHSMGSLGGSRSNSPMARRVSSSSDGSEINEESLEQTRLDSTFLSLFAGRGGK